MADAGEVKVKITAELDDLESKLSDAENKVKSFADEAKDAGIVKLEADASGVESGTASAGGAISSFTSSAVGQLALLAAAVYVVKEAFELLSEAVQIASAAEAAATQTALKTGETTTSGFQARSKEIQAFARDYAVATGDSSEEINKSLQKLYGYGFTGAPTEAILEPFHELSHALNTDMVTATNLVESSQVHFGKTMEDNSHIADVWAKAITSSNLEPAAIDLKTLGMAAKEGGMSLEDTAAMLSVLSAKDLPDPTTAIRMGVMALSNMKDPVAEYDKKTGKIKWTGVTDGTEALKKLGMTASSVKAEPLLDTLEKMHDAGASLSDFKEIFGARTGMLISNIADNIDGIRELSDEMEHTTGTTKVMASTVDGIFTKSWDRAGQAAEGIKEKIGADMQADIQPLLDIFSTSGYDAIMAFIEGLGSGDFSGVGAKMDKFAGELGKNIASQISEGFDLARGLIKWDWSFLTGKTPLDAFLKPIEQIFRAEFGLIAAEMKLKMKEGSVGAVQAIYTFHDEAVMAIAGVLASVRMLADAFASTLVGAINDASTAILGFKLIPTTNISTYVPPVVVSGDTADSSGFIPSVNKDTQALDAYARASQEFEDKSDDAGAMLIQSVGGLKSYADRLSRMTGLPVEIAPAQLMGTGYTASFGASDITRAYSDFVFTMDNLPNTISKPITDFFDSIPNELSTGIDKWGRENVPKIGAGIGIPQPKGVSGLSEVNTGSIAKSSSQIAQNTEVLKTWDQYNREYIEKMGGRLGKYEPDLSKEREDVSIAQRLLNDTLEGLKDKTDQDSDSMERNKDSVNALGQSCQSCTQANNAATQIIIGQLQALTGTEALDPLSFRSAVENLGSMYEASFVGPTALWSIEHPELMGKAETLRLGSIAGKTEAEYRDYYMSVIPEGGALTREGMIVSTVYAKPEGGGGDWLGCAGGEEVAHELHVITANIVADTTNADKSITDTKERASETQTMQVTADIRDAEDSITNLGDIAGQGKDMPIKLGGYESARAKIDDLTTPEYKYIYIITVKGGGGTSGIFQNMLVSSGEYNRSGIYNVGNIPFSGSPNTSLMDIPSFQDEGFVPRPTLAVVGDRPGGEYVLSAERVQRMAGEGGGRGGSVTLNAPLIVNAPIYGVSDLDQRFAEHTREIEQLVASTQWR